MPHFDVRGKDSLIVVTHNGRFQADEVFAIAALRFLNEDLQVQRVHRDNSPAIQAADMRVDIGKKFAPETGDFDHHQAQGAGVRPGAPAYRIPYASAGLIWLTYGLEICGGDAQIWENVDRQLFIHVDAADTGHKLFEGTASTVPTIIARHNHDNPYDDEGQMDRFLRMVDFAKLVIEDAIRNAQKELERSQMIAQALKETTNTTVLELPRITDWRDSASRKLLREHKVRAVIMPFNGDSYAVQITDAGIFPDSWRKQEKACHKLLGLSGQVRFKNRRQGWAENRSTALELARTLTLLPAKS